MTFPIDPKHPKNTRSLNSAHAALNSCNCHDSYNASANVFSMDPKLLSLANNKENFVTNLAKRNVCEFSSHDERTLHNYGAEILRYQTVDAPSQFYFTLRLLFYVEILF